MAETVVFLASGGLDSSIGMALMLEQGYTIYPLHVTRGAKADARELDAVLLVYDRLSAIYPSLIKPMEYVNVTFPPAIWKRAYYPADVERLGHPMRDIMLQALGVQYAESINSRAGESIRTVMVGQTCDEVIPHASEEALQLANLYVQVDRDDDAWAIRSPFLWLEKMSKADVVRWAWDHGFPIEETWSCFEGGVIGCGECQECIRRREAIKKAKVA
jgi:7-cyano-7-deazaguanine synthase